ncbi:MAG: hypothetical protein K2M91_12745, partial [Lachnospiraceae bacterium]|nr:hypothetical protein [Lachnospiraceae bacterium]
YYKVSLNELTSFSEFTSDEALDENDSNHSDIQIIHHLKSKNIPINFVLEMSKADFDFLKDYKELTDDNKAELRYLMNYKLKKQALTDSVNALSPSSKPDSTSVS